MGVPDTRNRWNLYLSCEMKKLILFLFLITPALAESSLEFEYGAERYTQAPSIKGPSAVNEHFAITPSTTFHDFQFGLDYEINRDTTKGSPLQSMLEAQISHDLFTIGQFTTSLQVGLGRIINQVGGDYSHYQFTLEEDYKVNKSLTLTSNYRYRNAFDNIQTKYYFESNTGKIGFAYEIVKNVELGVRYTTKFGAQQHAHGMEGGFVVSF